MHFRAPPVEREEAPAGPWASPYEFDQRFRTDSLYECGMWAAKIIAKNSEMNLESLHLAAAQLAEQLRVANLQQWRVL